MINIKKECIQTEYDNHYENDYDIDFENINEIYEDPIDTFISDYTDDIIKLYYEIIHQFPYVLNNMSSSHLMSFIINHNHNYNNNRYTKKYNKKTFNLFENEFNIEILQTLNSVNNYTYTQITYDEWSYFLYNFANV